MISTTMVLSKHYRNVLQALCVKTLNINNYTLTSKHCKMQRTVTSSSVNLDGPIKMNEESSEDSFLGDPSAQGSNKETALYLNPTIQGILKRLTGLDYDKVFRVRKVGQKLKTPTYAFLTEEELKQAMQEMSIKAEKKMQMPPYLPARKPVNEVLDVDPDIKGYDTAKYIFTDISFGVSDKDRIIVVRESEGTLRKASWEERDRMNQIYFTKVGRMYRMPKMFQEDLLQNVLDRGEYEFVLDRACIQFEPDDGHFLRITKTTYTHIDVYLQYEALRSTRHFAPMVFYLTTINSIDSFLLYLIQSERLDDVVDLFQLYSILFPEKQTAVEVRKLTNDPYQLLKIYIEHDSKKSSILQLALQTLQEKKLQEQEIEKGIQKAHSLETS